MKQEEEFIKGVERLVKPEDVVAISFLNTFNRFLPQWLQKRLMAKTAKQFPYIGFVVEPYSFFLCYNIADTQKAQSLLPEHYQLVETQIFTDDEPGYYGIFGCFTAHTGAFWGSRIEMYIIAEDTRTGMLTWVIVDYDTNTNSYDPARGLVAANCADAVMTTDYNGQLFVDMKRDDNSRRLAAHADTRAGNMRELDQRLWLEGNLSVDYGGELSGNSSSPFSLRFRPEEVEQAMHLPAGSFTVEENSWHPGLFEKEPAQVLYFPYAQHFVTTMYPNDTPLMNREELLAAVQELGTLEQVRSFSAGGIKKQLFAGAILSSVFTASLVVYVFVDMVQQHL